eukprot:jgi/Chrzof1/10788/Cz05g12040.t1
MACCKKQPKVEKPVYDDENCPYGIKPSELFTVNEVSIHVHAHAGNPGAAGEYRQHTNSCGNNALQAKDMDRLKALGGVEGLAKALHTNTHDGLDLLDKGPGSVEEHRRVFGPNVFKATVPKNFFMLCFENLQDPIILLLIAAALVSLDQNPTAATSMFACVSCEACVVELADFNVSMADAQTRYCYVQVSTVLGAALPEQRAHNEWIEGVAIWIAVFVVVCVGESPIHRLCGLTEIQHICGYQHKPKSHTLAGISL